MKPSKHRPTVLASTLKAYQAFHQAADRGNYQKAFTIFKAQPHLLNHMTILEISMHCRMMTSQLSRREALPFIEAVERRLLEMTRLFDRTSGKTSGYIKRTNIN